MVKINKENIGIMKKYIDTYSNVKAYDKTEAPKKYNELSKYLNTCESKLKVAQREVKEVKDKLKLSRFKRLVNAIFRPSLSKEYAETVKLANTRLQEFDKDLNTIEKQAKLARYEGALTSVESLATAQAHIDEIKSGLNLILAPGGDPNVDTINNATRTRLNVRLQERIQEETQAKEDLESIGKEDPELKAKIDANQMDEIKAAVAALRKSIEETV